MTFREDSDWFKDRIARAESERDAWLSAGREAKYLEAYFMVEALEIQLDERLRRHSAHKPHD
ncbi:MAG TPA: hypothetical protein VFU71_17955 [Burkholderiaceae bacterium]|nr:hypothetical protein [Burkholderiaceae bacterium]